MEQRPWRKPGDRPGPGQTSPDPAVEAARLHDRVIGRLYDVAVDPRHLADLLDDWERLNRPLRQALDEAMGEAMGEPTGQRGGDPLEPAAPGNPAGAHARVEAARRQLDFAEHFQRVTRLLHQSDGARPLRPEEAELQRFSRTAAFAVGPALTLTAANEATRSLLAVDRGDGIDRLPLEPAHLESLRGLLRRLLGQGADPAPARLRRPAARPGAVSVLRLRLRPEGRLILAQCLLSRPAGQAPFVLVVTSELRWPESQAETLREAFGLTRAEAQILSALSQARPVREIAEERGRSVETVRAQIKAILAKTETRSQGELMRLALSVSDLAGAEPPPAGAEPVLALMPSGPGGGAARPPANGSVPGAGETLLADPAPAITGPLGRRFDSARAWGDGTPQGRAGGMVRFSHAGGTLPVLPFRSMMRSHGRRMEYLVLGDPEGAPLIWCHGLAGFGRWPAAMEAAAARAGLRVLVPVRAGFGASDPLPPVALRDGSGAHAAMARFAWAAEDAVALMDRLQLSRAPVLAPGGDIRIAALMAARHPDRVSAIIGCNSVLMPPSAAHYDEMGRWHRFLLGGARFTPDLLPYMLATSRAMARRTGYQDFMTRLFAQSPADSACFTRPALRAALQASHELILDPDGNPAAALLEELVDGEAVDCSPLMDPLEGRVPVHVLQGGQDLRCCAALQAAMRRRFPWITFHDLPEAGELMFLQESMLLLDLAARYVTD